jgi:hypothetical protein
MVGYTSAPEELSPPAVKGGKHGLLIVLQRIRHNRYNTSCEILSSCHQPTTITAMALAYLNTMEIGLSMVVQVEAFITNQV